MTGETILGREPPQESQYRACKHHYSNDPPLEQGDPEHPSEPQQLPHQSQSCDQRMILGCQQLQKYLLANVSTEYEKAADHWKVETRGQGTGHAEVGSS